MRALKVRRGQASRSLRSRYARSACLCAEARRRILSAGDHRMGAIAITGAGSGIGAATRARLQRAGKRVLGVDLRGAEIAADLGKAAGRAQAAREIVSLVRAGRVQPEGPWILAVVESETRPAILKALEEASAKTVDEEIQGRFAAAVRAIE